MNQNFALSLAAVGLVCGSIPAARADDPNATNAPAATNAQTKSGGSHLGSLPKAIAGFCAGAIVGTPICFVRKFPKELNDGAHSFVGSIGSNDNKKLLFIPAYVAWIPFAGFISLVEAPAYAVKDAYTAEKPFSKEQFSLGELDQ
jgi:hypothetical protein